MDVQRPKSPRKRVRPNRKAQDQRIILMWIKRIGIGIMVLLLFTWTSISLSSYISRKTTYRATIARVTAAK